MNCKFCQAELPEDVTLCPACGKENLEEVVEDIAPEAEQLDPETEAAEEAAPEAPAAEAEAAEEAVPEAPASKGNSLWVKILAIIGGIALLAVLVGAVLYGTGAFDQGPDSYTVSDAKAIKSRDTVVATVGDVELTNSELQVYYWQAVSEFTEYYSYYIDVSTLGLDLNKPLDEQYNDEESGITWQQYFLDIGLNTWNRYAALSMQAKEDGYTLNEEMTSYLDSVPEQLVQMAEVYGYSDVQSMITEDMSAACDETGYLNFLYNNFFAGQYFDSLYESMEPTLEEIEAYYQENQESLSNMGITDDGSKYVDVRHILICPQGGTEDEEGNITYSDAEWETCRATAQEILDQWQAGEATEESFAMLAMEKTEDPGSQSTGGLYTDVYVGQMVEPFEDWCFDESRAYGDTGLVQTTYGYHIMYFVAEEPVYIANVRDTIINDRSTDVVDAAVAKWPMEVNYKKIVLGAVGETEAE